MSLSALTPEKEGGGYVTGSVKFQRQTWCHSGWN